MVNLKILIVSRTTKWLILQNSVTFFPLNCTDCNVQHYEVLYTHYYPLVLVIVAVVLAYSLALAFVSFVELPLANIYKFPGVKRRK